MADPDLIARLRSLTDPDLRAAIEAATADRPALRAVHAAAVADDSTPTTPPAVPTPPEVPSSPAVPATPDIPNLHDVPPPTQIAGTSDHTVSDYTAGGVPTYDSVRDKVEERYGTALGAEELGRDTPAGRSLQEQWDEREKAGREKLERIRRSMNEGNE